MDTAKLETIFNINVNSIDGRKLTASAMTSSTLAPYSKHDKRSRSEKENWKMVSMLDD